MSEQIIGGPLGKHKYYCELCRKQCKDQNAFLQHKKSAYHVTQMNEFSERPDFFLQKFSSKFKYQFEEAFSTKCSRGKWIAANQIYNDMIRDPKHVHLNATKWTSLGSFIKDLCESEGSEFSCTELDGVIQIMQKSKITETKPTKLSSLELKIIERKRDEKQMEKQLKRAQKIEAMMPAKPLITNNQNQVDSGSFQFDFSSVSINQKDSKEGKESLHDGLKPKIASIFNKQAGEKVLVSKSRTESVLTNALAQFKLKPKSE